MSITVLWKTESYKANDYLQMRERLELPLKINANAPNTKPIALKKAKKKKEVSFPNRKEPEKNYEISDAHYENIKSIISLACISMEKTARTFNKLLEEELRAVCGRLKSNYRYTGKIVYNNFPWPNPTDAQRQKVEQTAQGILDARALYPDSSLADLYDELTMPPELRKAHTQNDKAVMQAYGVSIKDTTEESCVAKLMKLYQQLTSM